MLCVCSNNTQFIFCFYLTQAASRPIINIILKCSLTHFFFTFLCYEMCVILSSLYNRPIFCLSFCQSVSASIMLNEIGEINTSVHSISIESAPQVTDHC